MDSVQVLEREGAYEQEEEGVWESEVLFELQLAVVQVEVVDEEEVVAVGVLEA